jgi:hypothetical protein
MNIHLGDLKVELQRSIPHHSNNEMNSEWNQGQLDRFQMGQAAVIQDEEQSTKSAIELAKLLMSICTP